MENQKILNLLSKSNGSKFVTRNNDYTTGSLLDYSYHQNYYKLIGIDLLRQTNTTIPQQTNVTRKLE